MGRKIYLGNIPVSTGKPELQQVLSAVGTAETIHLGTHGDPRRPSGFAFVEMATDEEAARAIAVLDQTEMGGWQITVSQSPRLIRREARPKTINNEFGGRRPEDSRFLTAFAV